LYFNLAHAVRYGATLVRDGEMNGGNVITVFFAIITGAMSLGQVL
jgi:hypothetical protein